jgi:hypothetical protein
MPAKISKDRFFLFEVELTKGVFLAALTGSRMNVAEAKLFRRSDFVRVMRKEEVSKAQFDLAVSKLKPLPSLRRMLTPAR